MSESAVLEQPRGKFNLQAVTSGVSVSAIKTVIYGPHGIGKTTFAAQAAKPIILMTEDGKGMLDTPRFPDIAKTYADVKEAITSLLNDDHDYQTLVLDSATSLEPIIWKEVVAEHKGAESISDNSSGSPTAYGRGLSQLAPAKWREIIGMLDLLRSRKGMRIIIIAHSDTIKVKTPGEEYMKYGMRMHKGASDILADWADNVGFCNYKVYINKVEEGFGSKRNIPVGEGERVIHFNEKPSYTAKNRFKLPDELPLQYSAFSQALGAAINKAKTGEK